MATPTSTANSITTQTQYPGPTPLCDASAVSPLTNYTALLETAPIQICQVNWAPSTIDIGPCCTGPVSVQDNCTQYCPAGPQREGQANFTQLDFNECVDDALRRAGVGDMDVRRTSGYCFMAPALNGSGNGNETATQAPGETETPNAAPHAINMPTITSGLWSFAMTAAGLAFGASLIL